MGDGRRKTGQETGGQWEAGDQEGNAKVKARGRRSKEICKRDRCTFKRLIKAFHKGNAKI
jgi:hypothetical protein